MSDNVTLDIPIDEARRLLKQYPNSSHLKDAVKKWDEEHEPPPPTTYQFLGTVTEEELEILREDWPEWEIFGEGSPSGIMQRIVNGEVEEVAQLAPFYFTLEKFNAMPDGTEFTTSAHLDGRIRVKTGPGTFDVYTNSRVLVSGVSAIGWFDSSTLITPKGPHKP